METEIEQQKEVSYYEAMVNSFLENRMEIDKQILNLSCLAIGFLSATIKEVNSLFCMWLFTNIFFLLSIILVLFVFHSNTKIVENIIQNKNFEESENNNRILSVISYLFFGIAMFLLIIYTPLNLFINNLI